MHSLITIKATFYMIVTNCHTNLSAVEEVKEARQKAPPQAMRMHERSTNGCQTTPARHLNGQFLQTHFLREHLLHHLKSMKQISELCDYMNKATFLSNQYIPPSRSQICLFSYVKRSIQKRKSRENIFKYPKLYVFLQNQPKLSTKQLYIPELSTVYTRFTYSTNSQQNF